METNQNQLYQLSQMSVVVAHCRYIFSKRVFTYICSNTYVSLLYKYIHINIYLTWNTGFTGENYNVQLCDRLALNSF